jgi:hypothetical protein
VQLNISQIVLNQKWLFVILANLSTTFHVEHFDQMFHVERYAIFISAGTVGVTGGEDNPDLGFREQCSTWNTRSVFESGKAEKRSTEHSRLRD